MYNFFRNFADSKNSICLEMKHAVRISFLFLVLVIFITWTTGVSFYIHECNSSHKKEVVAFPEIFNNNISCCCQDEIHGSITSYEPVSSFSEPECCRNTHVYLKASFTGFPMFYQFNPEVLQKVILLDFLSVQHNENVEEIAFFAPRVDHPPPRSGKILIHFLHQVKIPAPVS
jgi:hypothetical protein